MNDTAQAVTVAPGGVAITQLTGINVLSQGVRIKAPSTNVKDVKIAGSKKEIEDGQYYPLSKGEVITMDIKGAGLWIQNEEAADKLHILSVMP